MTKEHKIPIGRFLCGFDVSSATFTTISNLETKMLVKEERGRWRRGAKDTKERVRERE